jgi:hypothetical protein
MFHVLILVNVGCCLLLLAFCFFMRKAIIGLLTSILMSHSPVGNLLVLTNVRGTDLSISLNETKEANLKCQ